MGGREELAELIDALARAAFAGDRRLIETRRREALALVTIIVPPSTKAYACPHCGIGFASGSRLGEHVENVHHDAESR